MILPIVHQSIYAKVDVQLRKTRLSHSLQFNLKILVKNWDLLSYHPEIWHGFSRVTPFVRLLKHQLLKHRLLKHQLLALKHWLSKRSNVKNIDWIKHRVLMLTKNYSGNCLIHIITFCIKKSYFEFQFTYWFNSKYVVILLN